MNNIINSLLLICLLLIVPNFVLGSDCICKKRTSKFRQKLNDANYVGVLEYLGIEYDSMISGQFPVKKFLVRKSYKTNKKRDTISVITTSGLDCLGSFMMNLNLGDKYLVKLNVTDLENYSSNMTGEIYYLKICSIPCLPIRNDKVFGPFKRNKAYRRIKISKFLNWLSFRKIRPKSRSSSIDDETSFNTVNKILIRKLKTNPT